jgi:hypothetical protein
MGKQGRRSKECQENLRTMQADELLPFFQYALRRVQRDAEAVVTASLKLPETRSVRGKLQTALHLLNEACYDLAPQREALRQDRARRARDEKEP